MTGDQAALPAVNDLVRVSLGDADDPDVSQLASRVPSRVEDLRDPALPGRGSRLLVAAPSFEGDLDGPMAGTHCTLQWTSDRGLWILPVSFHGMERTSGGVLTWEVEVIGKARREERRTYVRVPWILPLELALKPGSEHATQVNEALKAAAAARGDESAPGAPLTGSTVNLGEGGVLCLIEYVGLPGGCPVIATVTVDGRQFVLPSRITWSMAAGSPDALCAGGDSGAGAGGAGGGNTMAGAGDPATGSAGAGPASAQAQWFQTALAFDDPTQFGDELRPLLFAEQLSRRRDGLA